MEFKVKTQYHLHWHPKNEILRYKYKKYIKNQYEENYKTMIKEIKELNKWGGISYSWIGRLKVVNMSVLLNLIYKPNVISARVSASYFVDIDKVIQKLL